MLQKSDGQESDVQFDWGTALSQSEGIMDTVHDMMRCFNICFGGGSICFMMRYRKELTLSCPQYPDIVKDCNYTWNLLLNQNAK